MENSWNIESLYDLRYFNCASCDYKIDIKQDFVNHAYEFHPEALNYLKNIKDDSMDDISCPWNNVKKLEEIHPNLRGISASIEILPKISKMNQEDIIFDDENLNYNNDFSFTNMEYDPFKNIANKNEVNSGNTKIGGLISLTCIYCHEPVSRIEIQSHFEKCKMERGKFKRNHSKNLSILKSQPHQAKHVEEVSVDNFISKIPKYLDKIQKVEKVKCELCDVITTKFRLKKHMAREHEAAICDKCGREFESQRKLKMHDFSKHTRKPWSQQPDPKTCEICGKMFRMKRSLRDHIKKIHEKILNHQCTTCGKSFFTASELKMHTQCVHEGLKNFTCDRCGKAFGRPEFVRRHVITVHEGIKKYKCSFCNTAYGQSGDLKRHIKRAHSTA